MVAEMAQDQIGKVRRGRPPIAADVSQLPATTVPAAVHNALAREALRRDVPMAQVVREAIISHLENRQSAEPAAR